MRDRIKIIILTTILSLMYCATVFGYSGNGTSKKPYVVSSESDLKTVLEEKSANSNVYVKINDTIGIKKTINVKKGRFIIYAGGEDQIITRSSSKSADINDQKNPGYCMKISSGASVSVGTKGDYYIILGGNKAKLDGIKMSGWLRVENGGSFSLGEKGKIRNCNSNETDRGSPVLSNGTINISGEIYSCEGYNGGAIKNYGGTLNIKNGAKIRDCSSKTEGGAIYNANGGKVIVNGAQIYNCTAMDEGGAIFSKDSSSECNVLSGSIYGNKSGQTAGAIFSGYGATLNIGNNSTGPSIYNNEAGESGGAIRCNGGVGDNAGGISCFYRGSITGNTSGKNGGAISCGGAGKNAISKLYVANMVINSNSCEKAGGGIWIAASIVGTATTEVKILNCEIKLNVSKYHGGGIYNEGNIYLDNNKIENNITDTCGGGVHIKDTGTVRLVSGTITGNKTEKRTVNIGVYVNGKFKISDSAIVDTSNVVYLPKGKYVETVGKLNQNYNHIAKLESADKSNGTKLVYVNYSGGTAERELYQVGNGEDEYTQKSVKKRFTALGLSNSQLLRSGKMVSSIGDKWIIISEKYLITYNSNTTDSVTNMPESQIKFWSEEVKISDKVPLRKMYTVNEGKHWNTLSNGNGTKIASNTTYKTNASVILYAQWQKAEPTQIFITTRDRYYIKKQNIQLSAAEILKKVVIKDEVESGYNYKINIVEIWENENKLIVEAMDIQPENYISTQEIKEYKIKIHTETKNQDVESTGEFKVYIIDEAADIGTVRFISQQYLYTLNNNSKWNQKLKTTLIESLAKTNGQGKYKIKYTAKQLKEIKEEVRRNNYKIKIEE